MATPICAPEYFVVIQGEDRTLPLRAVNRDYTSFKLTGVTEIRARFKRTNGSVLEKRLSDGAVHVIDEDEGRFTVDLTQLETPLILVGERQSFTVLIDKGLRSTATHGGGTFSADLPGTLGNNIVLNFDGIKTVQQVVNAWNTANPTNLVEFSMVLGTDVLPAGSVTLAGGTNNRRIVQYASALTVQPVIV